MIRFFFFQAEDGIRDTSVTGVQTCALPIAGRGAADGEVLSGTRRAGIHDEPAARGPRSAGEPHRPEVERRVADAGARLARAAPRATPLFLEEREVGARVRATGGRPAGILGAERLSHAGRSVDGGALRRSRPDTTRDQ